ncbi:MAG: ABC transporter substrate-binding protein [Thermomicrobiales bacterium]
MSTRDPRFDFETLTERALGGRMSRRELARRGAFSSAAAAAARLGGAGSAGLGAGLGIRAVRAQEEPGGTINVAQTGGDSSMGNPILVGGTDNYPFRWAFSRLIQYDDTGVIIPDLADEWSYDSSGTEVTFKLNPAALWHDGEPVTSEDVIFTFDTIKDENTKTNRRSNLQVGGEYINWAAPDAGTVVITTPEPFAPLLFSLSIIGIIPRHMLADVEDINTDPFNLSPIGSGPFRIVEWQQNIVTRYERFEEYFRGPAAAEALNEVFFENAAPALASLEAGEVDVVFAPPELQAPFEDHPDFLLLRYVYYTPITLSFNQKHPLLQDLTLRRAIELAIDKDSLDETLTKGRNSRTDNQYADSGPLDRYNDYSLPNAEFNVVVANGILDDAGYTIGADGIRKKAGERLSFPMLTYSGFEEYRNGLEILHEMLGAIGIETTPEVIDYSALAERWADPEDDALTRPMTLEEYPHPFEQDPDVFDELHSTNFPPGGNNYNYFADDQVDELIEQGRTETDEETRVGIYHQLDARRKETIPAIPLYLATDSWVFSRKVGGIPEDTPSSRWFLRCCIDQLYKEE